MSDIKTLIAGKRCLVLDDEFLIALDIQQVLESAGAESVICVGNSVDAIAALRNGAQIDFAVLDVKLNGGARTSVAIAEILAENHTPFVFVTGISGNDVHTRRFPDAPVIEKPYEPLLLAEAIRRAFGPR